MTIASQPKTDNGVVRAFVDIAASPEDVFKALTDSRELVAHERERSAGHAPDRDTHGTSRLPPAREPLRRGARRRMDRPPRAPLAPHE